jgi:hypothetical protein
MQQRTKGMIGGAIAGIFAAGMLAVPTILPQAIAQEEPARTLLKSSDELFPEQLDGSDFVKPVPEFIVEPWVSTDVVKEQTVRKIGYGKTTFVRIITTTTGTYSTDGLRSPHVRYPGIHPNPEFEDWEREGGVAIWSDGNWILLNRGNARSFVNLVPFDGGRLLLREDGSGCTRVGPATYC